MATILGIHPQTLRRWGRCGLLPEYSRTPGHHRRFASPEKETGATIGYVRVSSHDQKADLASQESALHEKAQTKGIKIGSVIRDIGSGMYYKKKGFRKLMDLLFTGQVGHLVIMHKDRLLRFGSELIFLICRAFNVRVTILEESPAKAPVEQLAVDLVEIVTVFSSRLYGMRSRSNKRSNAQLLRQLLETRDWQAPARYIRPRHRDRHVRPREIAAETGEQGFPKSQICDQAIRVIKLFLLNRN